MRLLAHAQALCHGEQERMKTKAIIGVDEEYTVDWSFRYYIGTTMIFTTVTILPPDQIWIQKKAYFADC